MMSLIDRNIQNMTSLWRLGGEMSGDFYQESAFKINVVSESQWPNKLWFQRMPTMALLQKIQSRWNMDYLSVSVWDPFLEVIEKDLLANGFSIKHTLVGMSITLDSFQYEANHIELTPVFENHQVIRWCQLFFESFGYDIHPKTVVSTLDHVQYFIAETNGQSFGTGILFKDHNGQFGIHAIGVIPEYRKQGWAESIMNELLLMARAGESDYAFLQASAMGLGLYHKLGFREDFLIKTFTKK